MTRRLANAVPDSDGVVVCEPLSLPPSAARSTSARMTAAVRELAAADVPVRWVLIDDGHQVEKGLRLKSLAPDPATFPDGWAPIVELRSPTSIRWIGLWHCFQGLWRTLDEENNFGDLNDDLALLPSGGYLPRGDEAACTPLDDGLSRVELEVQPGEHRITVALA